jgi:hypothetical protein
MISEKTLSDIAKSLLVQNPDGNPKTLREKAGLLALINLLGIMDAFFGVTLPESQEQVLRAVKEAPQSVSVTDGASQGHGENVTSETDARSSGHVAGEPTLSLFSSLAKSLSGTPLSTESSDTPGTPRLTPASEGFDPKLVAPMLSMIATLARAFKPKASDGEKVEGPANEGDRSGEAGAETSKQPSPLHQALGFDPKILTMLLNIIASMDFMKQRNGDGRTPDRKGSEPGSAESIAIEPKALESKATEAKVSAVKAVEHKAVERKLQETEAPKGPEQKVSEPKQVEEKTITSKAVEPKVADHIASAPKPEAGRNDVPKDPLVQLIRKRPATKRIYHKPGLGIYRGWPGSPVIQ